MLCEECCGVMGMKRTVDSCPARSVAVSTRHNIERGAFYFVMMGSFFGFYR